MDLIALYMAKGLNRNKIGTMSLIHTPNFNKDISGQIQVNLIYPIRQFR